MKRNFNIEKLEFCKRENLEASIILPVMGGENSRLKRLLDELKYQSFQNFEVIIVSGIKRNYCSKVISLFGGCINYANSYV